jgi:hypothetical protein
MTGQRLTILQARVAHFDDLFLPAGADNRHQGIGVFSTPFSFLSMCCESS